MFLALSHTDDISLNILGISSFYSSHFTSHLELSKSRRVRRNEFEALFFFWSTITFSAFSRASRAWRWNRPFVKKAIPRFQTRMIFFERFLCSTRHCLRAIVRDKNCFNLCPSVRLHHIASRICLLNITFRFSSGSGEGNALHHHDRC